MKLLRKKSRTHFDIKCSKFFLMHLLESGQIKINKKVLINIESACTASMKEKHNPQNGQNSCKWRYPQKMYL